MHLLDSCISLELVNTAFFGFTSFKNINDDIYNLVNYIRREFSEYKIIIHGISIGGYSAIKLALELDDEKNVVLISDRTFGDINLIVRDLKYGNFLESIYLFLFPKCFYNTSNIENYLKVKGNKIKLFFMMKMMRLFHILLV